MKALRRFVRRLAASVFGRRDDDRMRDELAEHLALLTDEHVRAGLSLDDARRSARLKLGAETVTTEAYRDEQSLRWLDDLVRDLRHGLRMLWRSRGFAAAAVVTLALGMGATASVFSVVDVVMLKPLPVQEPDRLIVVKTLTPRGEQRNISFPLFQSLRGETQVFTGVLAVHDDLLRYDMVGPEATAASEEVAVQLVSGEYF